MKKIDISHLTLPDNFHTITDFYLPAENPTYGLYYPGPDLIMNNKLLSDFANILLSETLSLNPEIEFNLEFVYCGRRIILRGHSIVSTEGKVFIYRRLPSYIPKFEELQMPERISEILLSERLNTGGLVIVAGETGQGKSTTAGSMISYRLRHFGSFCLTIEDPVELPLQGFYENDKDPNVKGVCFQTNIKEDGIFDAIKSSMRCYPSISNSILFLGETRDSTMASEVLKVAANGHLVVTTMHGADINSSLRRFLNLAAGAPGANEQEVRLLFSTVFRLLIHQRLDKLPNGKKKIRPQVLFSSSHTSPVANRLRGTGNLDMLATEIAQQNQKIQQGQSILYSS